MNDQVPPGEVIDLRAYTGATDAAQVAELPPLYNLEQLQEHAEAVSWVVKGAIPADSIGVLFGGSGTFKSFIALDLALHVAHGLRWLGRRTQEGPVLYIAAEGGAGLWRRIDAWHRARRLRWQDAPLYVIPVAVDLGTDALRVQDAAKAAGVTPTLVVVDTLSQTFSGEENSANEVAAYLREIGLLLRAAWQCAVVVIHHSGHMATERPRGSSAIRSNVDWMLGVFRDEKEMLATVTGVKQKDGETLDDSTFSLTQHELGVDSDGDKVVSLVARHLSSAEEVEQAAAREVAAGRGGRNQLLLSLLHNGMREAELRKAFYEGVDVEGSDAKRQAYHRCLSWAKKHAYLDVAEGRIVVLQRNKRQSGA